MNPTVKAECERIANRAARRLLAEMDANPRRPLTGKDLSPLDNRSDEVSLLRNGERIPVGAGSDGRGRGEVG